MFHAIDPLRICDHCKEFEQQEEEEKKAAEKKRRSLGGRLKRLFGMKR